MIENTVLLRLLRRANILVVGAVVVLGLILVSGLWRQAQEERVRHALRATLLAIHNYSTTFHSLPESTVRDESGNALYSWRFKICPFVLPMKRNVDFKKPWTVAENRAWRLGPAPAAYCLDESLDTQVYAITGTDTIFDSSASTPVSGLPSSLIVLVEVRHSGTHWMQPGDVSVDELEQFLTKQKSICRKEYKRGFHVGFADGTVWLLSADTPSEAVRKLCTRTSAAAHSREHILGKFRL